MKTCLILLIGFLPFLTPAQPQPAAEAPDTNALVDQQYDIQIENGQLLIAPLKNRVDAKALYGNRVRFDENTHSVPATVGNLVDYLRAANTNLTVVLSPGAAAVKIGDLKFKSGNMSALVQALSVATDGAIEGRPLGRTGVVATRFGELRASGESDWALIATSRKQESRTLEAFNLSGYIQTLGFGNTPNNPPPPAVIQKNVDEIKDVIFGALMQLHSKSSEGPEFRYHAGTHLLIVTGDAEAIEVSRKIINALSGQQKYSREDVRMDLLDTNAPASQN